MLSCSKLLCGILSSDLCPSGSLNRIGVPKQVISDASGEDWVEQSPLGVCPLLQNYLGSNCYYVLVIEFYGYILIIGMLSNCTI